MRRQRPRPSWEPGGGAYQLRLCLACTTGHYQTQRAWPVAAATSIEFCVCVTLGKLFEEAISAPGLDVTLAGFSAG